MARITGASRDRLHGGIAFKYDFSTSVLKCIKMSMLSDNHVISIPLFLQRRKQARTSGHDVPRLHLTHLVSDLLKTFSLPVASSFVTFYKSVDIVLKQRSKKFQTLSADVPSSTFLFGNIWRWSLFSKGQPEMGTAISTQRMRYSWLQTGNFAFSFLVDHLYQSFISRFTAQHIGHVSVP